MASIPLRLAPGQIRKDALLDEPLRVETVQASGADLFCHQLSVVYDCVMKLARLHFLLGDPAGAGKTVMARQLQRRGLAGRIRR